MADAVVFFNAFPLEGLPDSQLSYRIWWASLMLWRKL